MLRVVEIRTYRLKPGAGVRFHELVQDKSLLLLRQWGMEVVAYGQSLDDPDAYFLVRAFDNLDHLRSSQEAFYSSEAWRQGPRQSIIELIEDHLSVVLWLNHEGVEAMRKSNQPSHS